MKAIVAALTLVWATATRASPPLYAYEWGCAGAGSGIARIEAVLGRPLDGFSDFLAFNSEDAMLNSVQASLSCWHKFRPGTPVVISVEMGTTDGVLSPTSTLAGKDDAFWTRMAQSFVANGYPAANIRLGEEENGNWYPAWDAFNHKGWPQAFAHARAVMKSVVPNLKVWFNPTLGYSATQQNADYPGDANVDGISWDAYASRYVAAAATSAEPNLWTREQGASWGWKSIGVWNAQMPQAIWEAGVGTGNGGTTVDDDVFLTSSLAADDALPKPLAAYTTWDVNAPDYRSQWSDGSQPHIALAMIKEFGSPVMKDIFGQYAAPFTDASTAPDVVCDNCQVSPIQVAPNRYKAVVYKLVADGKPPSLSLPAGVDMSHVYDPAMGAQPISQPGAVKSVALPTLAPGHPLVVAFELAQ